MADYGGIDWRRGMVHAVHVTQLQKDLKTLGFALVGEPDGGFGRRTFQALREFQIHASGDIVAHDAGGGGPLHARLTPVSTGAHRYAGPVHGVADAATRALLGVWLARGWRCPLLVNAWKVDPHGRKLSLLAENVWAHDDYRVSKTDDRPEAPYDVFFFAHDLAAASRVGARPDGTFLLGRYHKYGDFGGPVALPPTHVDPASEIVPQTLTGRGWGDLDPAGRSTFRVLRAVSEVECIGFFDCVNAYDSAIVSVGPCHWTLGLVRRSGAGGQIYDGELSAALAYAAWRTPDAFDRHFTARGVRADRSWTDEAGAPTGRALQDASARKYAGWMAFRTADGFAPAGREEAEGDVFKSWPWIHRFAVALREPDGLRPALWDMARMRLRDVGALPVAVKGATRRLDAVFTSELARALLHRWHIYRPAEIAHGGPGVATTRIIELATARPVPGGWSGDPAQWGDAHEAALLAAIDAAIAELGNQNLKDTTDSVRRWPAWRHGPNPRKFRLAEGLDPLSRARRSFRFDAAGLPPAP